MSEPTTDAVITVGDARGFVIEVPVDRWGHSRPGRYIVTARHCLPRLRSYRPIGYSALLSKLG